MILEGITKAFNEGVEYATPLRVGLAKAYETINGEWLVKRVLHYG